MRPRSALGRYVLHDEIASGGMGTVYMGHLRGSAGFSRIVAIKQLNPMLAKEPEFLAMFLDEARLAGRVRHPNVAATLDVVEADGEVLIVMEYVQGESLAHLMRLTTERGQTIPPAIVSAVMSGVLYGLHAAHEATDERGEPLRLVHRDVSPQNVLVGADGVARVVDFGVAKAAGRLQTTSEGRLKGKLSYMPPEQIHGQALDRRADVYAAGVVLWEALTGASLFRGQNEPDTISRVLLGNAAAPSVKVPHVSRGLDNVVLRALSRHAADRFSTAREMCASLLEACPPAAPHEVGEWVEACAHQTLSLRAARIAELESGVERNAASPTERDEALGAPSGSAPIPAAPHSQVSQVSSISVAVPGRREGARRPVLLVLAIAVLALGAFVLGNRRGETQRASNAAPAVSSEAPAKDVVPLASFSRPVASVAPSASAAVQPDASTAVPLAGPRKSSAVPAPKAQSGSPADCDPPYVRGSDGRKIWKRQCFGQTP